VKIIFRKNVDIEIWNVIYVKKGNLLVIVRILRQNRITIDRRVVMLEMKKGEKRKIL